MGDLPSALQESWKKKHFEDAEKVFSDAANGLSPKAASASFFKVAEEETSAAV